MTPQPKTRFNELIDRLQALDASSERNEFTLRQLKHDIETVASHHRGEGYELFGMLAAHSEDVEETKRCFEAARRLEPRSTKVLLNYAEALNRFGKFSDVRTLLQQAHTLDPSDLLVLNRFIVATALCCRFTDAVSLLGTREKLRVGGLEPWAAEFRKIHLFLAAAGVSDDDGEKIMSYVAEVLQVAKVFDVVTANRVASDEETQWLNVNIKVRRPVDVAVDLNERLAEREARSDLPPSALLNIGAIFISTRTHARHAS
jgi:tetratricopeptide (TPR) repeat protein